jgi:hypothetical protein
MLLLNNEPFAKIDDANPKRGRTVPSLTESIDIVRRERSRTVALRQQIRDALSTKGTARSKRLLRTAVQADPDS